MTHPLRTRATVAAFAGLSLIGLLAGCSASAGSNSSTASSSTSTDNLTSDNSSSSGATTYKNGSYTADGSYVSPGGQETISVSLTVKNNLVTAVTVKSVTADQTAQQYQAQFESGISSVVVGKKLSSLSVSRVAGSSLTSQGFNAALATIKADASS